MSTSRVRKRRRVRLGRSSNGMLMTPAEFDAVEDVDERYVYELVRGVVIVSPPPGDRRTRPERRPRLPSTSPPGRPSRGPSARSDRLRAGDLPPRRPTTRRSRRLGRPRPAPRSDQGRSQHRRRVRLEAETGSGPRLRGEAARIPRPRRPRILGDRPLHQDDDRLPPPAGRAGRGRRPRGRHLSDAPAAGVRAAPGTDLDDRRSLGEARRNPAVEPGRGPERSNREDRRDGHAADARRRDHPGRRRHTPGSRTSSASPTSSTRSG